MDHSTHLLLDGMYHRFGTDRGVVWVKVVPVDVASKTASIVVYEESSALASIPFTDDVAHRMPVMDSARNHFGTGLMLRIMRTVVASMPEVKKWVYERKTGACAGRTAERVYSAL